MKKKKRNWERKVKINHLVNNCDPKFNIQTIITKETSLNDVKECQS